MNLGNYPECPKCGTWFTELLWEPVVLKARKGKPEQLNAIVIRCPVTNCGHVISVQVDPIIPK